jgi:hypothetical protein
MKETEQKPIYGKEWIFTSESGRTCKRNYDLIFCHCGTQLEAKKRETGYWEDSTRFNGKKVCSPKCRNEHVARIQSAKHVKKEKPKIERYQLPFIDDQFWDDYEWGTWFTLSNPSGRFTNRCYDKMICRNTGELIYPVINKISTGRAWIVNSRHNKKKYICHVSYVDCEEKRKRREKERERYTRMDQDIEPDAAQLWHCPNLKTFRQYMHKTNHNFYGYMGKSRA